MKILGKTEDRRWPTFIVELSAQEMREISSNINAEHMLTGTTVNVSEQYRKAMGVARAAEQALQVPDALRSVANCLELILPAVKKIADGQPLPEATDDNR